MHSTISLREYNLRYPRAAAVPTLSQNGGLAWLLERRSYKAAKLARRLARWRRRREAMRHALLRGWQMLKEGVRRQTPPSATHLSPYPHI